MTKGKSASSGKRVTVYTKSCQHCGNWSTSSRDQRCALHQAQIRCGRDPLHGEFCKNIALCTDRANNRPTVEEVKKEVGWTTAADLVKSMAAKLVQNAAKKKNVEPFRCACGNFSYTVGGNFIKHVTKGGASCTPEADARRQVNLPAYHSKKRGAKISRTRQLQNVANGDAVFATCPQCGDGVYFSLCKNASSHDQWKRGWHQHLDGQLDGKPLTKKEAYLKREAVIKMRVYLRQDELRHKDGHAKFGHRLEPGLDGGAVTGMVARDIVRLYRVSKQSLSCYACGNKCTGVDSALVGKESQSGKIWWRRWTLDRLANRREACCTANRRVARTAVLYCSEYSQQASSLPYSARTGTPRRTWQFAVPTATSSGRHGCRRSRCFCARTTTTTKRRS